MIADTNENTANANHAATDRSVPATNTNAEVERFIDLVRQLGKDWNVVVEVEETGEESDDLGFWVHAGKEGWSVHLALFDLRQGKLSVDAYEMPYHGASLSYSANVAGESAQQWFRRLTAFLDKVRELATDRSVPVDGSFIDSRIDSLTQFLAAHFGGIKSAISYAQPVAIVPKLESIEKKLDQIVELLARR